MVSESVAPSAQLAPMERRRRARQRTRQSGVVISGELQLECTIVDQSETGARLAIKGALPGQFHLIRLKTGECHEARLVWSDDRHAGIAFLATYDLSQPTEQPKAKKLRLIWQRLNKR